MSEKFEEAPSEMNRQSKQIERVCDKVENKISYTCDVKNKCDVLSEIKENETSYMIDNSQTSDKLDNFISTYKKKIVASQNTNTEHKQSKKQNIPKQVDKQDVNKSVEKQNVNNSVQKQIDQANVNNSVQRHVGRKHIPSTNNGSRGSQKHERKILMIGNSHFRPIKTYDFLKDCQIKKHICYDINEASQFIDTITESYDCVVLHLFTNDVRDSENTESVSSEFELLVKKKSQKMVRCKNR
jgi:hypothetical protein